MKEVITIQIGKSGLQVGNYLWKLFGIDHNIQSDGFKEPEFLFEKENSKNEISDTCDNNTFYNETKEEKFIPRSLMIDLEEHVINSIRSGPQKDLYEDSNFFLYKEGGACNYARGHHYIGKKIIDDIFVRVQKMADNCDELQGFLVVNGIGGGTGSGLTTLLLKRLRSDFKKKSIVTTPIFPSPQKSTSVLEPYNTVLACHELLENSDLTLTYDNDALYDVCRRELQIKKPSYVNMNRLMGNALESITKPFRVNKNYNMNANMNEMIMNLVPYPRINFCVSAYAPILSIEKMIKELYVTTITNSCFLAPTNLLTKCDPRHGKYMKCCLSFRGDILPKDVSASVASIKTKRNIRFVDWVATGFKCGLTYSSPVYDGEGDLARVSRSVVNVSNTSAIAEVVSRFNHRFDLMWKKKAFVFWYVSEGMEEDDFSEAREDLAELEKDYEELEAECEEEGEEEGEEGEEEGEGVE